MKQIIIKIDERKTSINREIARKSVIKILKKRENFGKSFIGDFIPNWWWEFEEDEDEQ